MAQENSRQESSPDDSIAVIGEATETTAPRVTEEEKTEEEAEKAQAANLGFLIVINRSNPTISVEQSWLSDVFLKRRKNQHRWEDGTLVEPVDLEVKDPLRETFSRKIHDRSAQSVHRYGQRLIFSGRGHPPVVRESQADILSFVGSEIGAVGYVETGTDLGNSVKVLEVILD